MARPQGNYDLGYVKMHGAGNDFVMIDGRKLEEVPPERLQALAALLCDRRRGLGADGIVVRGTKKKYKDTGRFDHIAFAATDIGGVRKRLKSKKVKFREQIVPRTGAAQIFLYDPDGVGVELNFPPEEAKAA